MNADLETRRMQMPAEQAPRSSVPVRVLAVVAVGAVLYFGHAAFIPIALAILFALILTTPVEALHRRGVPRSAAALLILFAMVALLGGALDFFLDASSEMVEFSATDLTGDRAQSSAAGAS